MNLSAQDWQAIRLTLEVAALSTAILLFVGTPLAWWLARTRSRLAAALEAVVALPLVLPPTVLGFYLLALLGAQGPLGRLTESLGIGLLPFSFAGLVLASVLYSLPFMVQPLRSAFAAIGDAPLEAAATLRAGPMQRFFFLALPLARPGLLSGIIMSFAHTVGEFGVVLMMGGSIPGQTRVVSVQVYDYVETLRYPEAHRLAAALLVFSFIVLFTLHWVQRRYSVVGLAGVAGRPNASSAT